MIVFQNNTMERICAHAQNEYPKECCGIILGRQLSGKRMAFRIIQTGNRMDDSRNATRFLIDPLDIYTAELSAERENMEIVGFYHSHPDYEAAASDTDILYMISGYSYPIFSVKNGVCAAVKSFEKISQADTGAQEEKIEVKEKRNADFSICIGNIADICKPKDQN